MKDTNYVNRCWPHVAFVAFVAMVSLHFGISLQKNAKIFLNTQDYLSFTANKPYQARVLMVPVLGWLIEVLSAFSPQRFAHNIPAYLADADALAYCIINSVAFFVAVTSFSMLAARMFIDRIGIQRISLFLFVSLSYYLFCLNPGLSFVLPYDIPALAFTSICLLLFVQRSWILLIAVFALAASNRETILLVPILIFLQWLQDRSDFRKLILAAVLSLTWLAVKLALSHYLPTVPSEQASRLTYNLATLAKPWQWPGTFALPALIMLCAYKSVAAKSMRSWNAVAVIGFAILFYFANIDETRAFSDLVPYIAIAIAPTVAEFFGALAPPTAATSQGLAPK